MNPYTVQNYNIIDIYPPLFVSNIINANNGISGHSRCTDIMLTFSDQSIFVLLRTRWLHDTALWWAKIEQLQHYLWRTGVNESWLWSSKPTCDVQLSTPTTIHKQYIIRSDSWLGLFPGIRKEICMHNYSTKSVIN